MNLPLDAWRRQPNKAFGVPPSGGICTTFNPCSPESFRGTRTGSWSQRAPKMKSGPSMNSTARVVALAALALCHFACSLHAEPRMCLTGNAADPSANLQLDGRYTYYDGGTFSYLFPRKLVPNKVNKPL